MTDYTTRVVDALPIAYLPLSETTGSTAEDATTSNYDGTYSNVTLDTYTAPDNAPAPSFDSASSSYVNWYSVGLGGAIDPDVGTMMVWLRVDVTGTWTDGWSRFALRIYGDTSNYITIGKTSSGYIQAIYRAGGSTKSSTDTVAQSGTSWVLAMARWSTADDKFELWVNGEKRITQTSLGTWAGSITAIGVGVGGSGFGYWDGGLSHAAIWNAWIDDDTAALLSQVDLAEWRDPYHYQGYLYVRKPEIVYQSQISAFSVLAGTSAITQVDGTSGTVIAGDFADVTPNMTVCIGSSPGLDDKGRARIISTTPASHRVHVWTPRGVHEGELYPSTSYYMTVLNEYKVWMKPPWAINGAYYYDGPNNGADGTTYDQIPIANAGPPYAGFLDGTTWVGEVDFDASGSFAVADDGRLGGLSSDLFGGTYTLTASSGTPANAVDSNTGTYWQPSTSTGINEYMHVDFAGTDDKAIRQMTITASGNYGPTYIALQWSDDNVNWVTALYTLRLSWGTNETKTFDIHHVGAHQYWRLWMLEGCVSGTELRIEEWALYAEDRTAGTSPYSWDVKDGTITSGSSTSEQITVEFPPGFRYVELSVTDTNAKEGTTYVPVFVAKPYNDTTLTGSPDHTGATYTGNDTDVSYPASNAFDGTNARWETNTPTNTWLQVQFAQAEWLGSYMVKSYAASYAPKFWYIQGSNDGTNWTLLDTRVNQTFGSYEEKTYTLDDEVIIQPYEYYRMYIFQNGGSGVTTAVVEWELNYPSTIPGDTDLIRKFEVVQHNVEPMGQAIEFALHEPREIQGSYTEVSYSALTATASTTQGTHTAAKAFEDTTGPENTNDSDYWMATTTSGWLQATWTDSQHRQLKAYGVYMGNALQNNAPTAWTFQGSNDGSSWTTLDTQSGITWPIAASEQTFDLDDVAEYGYYRINVTTTGGLSLAISELNLYQYEGVIDGALVMYWERDWYNNVETTLTGAGPAGRRHMRFWGWVDSERTAIEPDERGTTETTILRCLDAGQRLNQLTDFTFMIEKDSAPGSAFQAKHPNHDTFAYLMGRWLTTVAEVTDWFWSNTGDHYNVGLMSAQGASVYDMINQKAQAIDHMLTCNKMGQLKIVPDLRSCAGEFRNIASTVVTLTAADYAPLSYTFSRTPLYHWVYSSGVGFEPHDADHGSFTAITEFAIAPGQIPGQGVNTETELDRLLALSDVGTGVGQAHKTTSFFERAGRSYAQKAAYRSPITLELVPAGDTGLDPAEGQKLKITIPSTVNNVRPRPLSEVEGVIRRMNIVHNHEAKTKTYQLEWEAIITNYVDAWEYEPT